MKHKTSELTGTLLDHAVAIAEGSRLPDYWRDPEDGSTWSRPGREEWNPSERWDQSGPIIERERIATAWHPIAKRWVACGSHENWTKVMNATGPTALIAAMRAYVASKFGDEVEL